MTDYFALLDQPRRAWLDLEQLKQIFHAKTLVSHPDATPKSPNESAFAELNEAYQVLRDPKRRLHHLLSLEGNAPSSRSGSIPKEIETLFPMVANLTQTSEALLQKLTDATSTLSRSLLKAEAITTANSLEQMLQQLRTLETEAEIQLQKISTAARTHEQGEELHALYLQFSYLTKWLAQLEEKQLRLTSAL